MGMMVKDTTALDVLGRMNKRFEPDSIEEMAALQSEFQIFSPQHSLRDSFSLLGIVPADPSEQERWYRYLEHLKTYTSDLTDVSGHDRIVKALQEGLEADELLPVAFVCHEASVEPRLTVSRGHAHVFMPHTFVIISFPTTPAPEVRRSAASAARRRRATGH